jgi:hypothetical protein
VLPICERAAEVRDGKHAATDVVAKGHERPNWSPSCCRLCSMLANFLPAEYAAELWLTDAARTQSQHLIGLSRLSVSIAVHPGGIRCCTLAQDCPPFSHHATDLAACEGLPYLN